MRELFRRSALSLLLPLLACTAQQSHPALRSTGSAGAVPTRQAPAAAAQPAPAPAAARARAGQDPHSFAEPTQVRVSHLALDLSVDFAGRKLAGTATLTLDNPDDAPRLVLDTNGLAVEEVRLGDGTPVPFRLGPEVAFLGRPLSIDLPPGAHSVAIRYATRPDAAALQWLTPEQTAGKQHPFLFTQSESILARSWVPIQDTPGVKLTYEATVHVPPGLLALMSAENPQQKSADGTYHFRMDQPVPAYLLALAVGDLEFRPVGPTTGVYAEPSVVDKAAWELADMQKMVATVEKLYGPYRWGRYDILVLPPSFPYGGMENPRLTFMTPTMLAGDRSLVSIVAHELAHSWSGNLVTNATWNDFWLNEGVTTYVERRVMEALYGRDDEEMLATLGLQDLRRTFSEVAARDQSLKLDLAGRDPDEGATDVAYEKGALFLRTIEQAVGRERFDPFLQSWFDQHAFRSATTEEFLRFLSDRLLSQVPGVSAASLEVQAWVYGPGLPDNAPEIDAKKLDLVDATVARWQSGVPAADLDTAGWNSNQWVYFLRQLPEHVAQERMADLEHAFRFSATGNSEILFAWLRQVVRNEYRPAYPALERFLEAQGRRKFLQPLYQDLAKNAEGMVLARRIYAQARPTYHPVAQAAVDKILGWPVQ